jgi:hypothetical protein
VDGDFERLAYETALRTLDKQEGLLNEIRARTGALLAAASLAASFLGRPAFDAGNRWLLVAALVAFAVAAGAALYVLMPKRDLVFTSSGSAVFEALYAFKDDMPEVHRRLAYDFDRFWDENDRVLAPLFLWFRRAGVALALEIVLLLAAVSGRLF